MQLFLIHGAWGTAGSWDEFVPEWRHHEPTLVIPTLPSEDAVSDLHADIAHVVELATGANDDVVLLGHSYGGAVITGASAQIPRLRGLIYVAAFKPDQGVSVSEMARRANERSQLDAAINLEGSELFLNLELAPAALYGNAPADVVSRDLALLHRQSIETFRQPIEGTVPVELRTHYVICTEDAAVPLDLQEQMAATCESSNRLVASHCPQNECPALLAECVTDILSGWSIESK